MRTVAAFDFDGTLSSRDNVVPYLRTACGTGAVARAGAAAGPALLAARKDPARRDDAKAIVVARLLTGRTESGLRDLGRRFARLVVARHLHPQVAERLVAHREAGHEVVLVSASLTLYLDAVAELLGVPTVLATAVAVDPDGRCTGALAGPNVRGPEKVRRLEAWLGADGAGETFVYAYGDSRGDDELLARADHGVRVDRRGGIPPLTLR